MKTVYRHNGEKVVGKVVDGVFKKSVSKSKHLFRKTGGSWAIDANILEQLPDETRIEIFEKEEKVLYVTTAKEFKAGIYLQYGDNGLQAFLSLDKFRVE